MSKSYRPYYSTPKTGFGFLTEGVLDSPEVPKELSPEQFEATTESLEGFFKAQNDAMEAVSDTGKAVSDDTIKKNIGKMVEETSTIFKIEDVNNDAVSDLLYENNVLSDNLLSNGDLTTEEGRNKMIGSQKALERLNKQTSGFKELSPQDKQYMVTLESFYEKQYKASNNVKNKGPDTSTTKTGQENLEDINKTLDEIKEQMKNNTADQINKSGKEGKWKEVLARAGVSIINIGVIVGAIFGIYSILAYEKTDCYYVTPEGVTQMGCHKAYNDAPNGCSCLDNITSDKNVIDASNGGSDEDKETIVNFCSDTTETIKKSIQCVVLGGQEGDEGCPKTKPNDGFCSADTNTDLKYYQYQQYSPLDIMGQQADWLGDFFNSFAKPFEWLGDHFGQVVLFVGIAIAAIILLKILSFFVPKSKSK
jgi:hypothetical protein